MDVQAILKITKYAFTQNELGGRNYLIVENLSDLLSITYKNHHNWNVDKWKSENFTFFVFVYVNIFKIIHGLYVNINMHFADRLPPLSANIFCEGSLIVKCKFSKFPEVKNKQKRHFQ